MFDSTDPNVKICKYFTYIVCAIILRYTILVKDITTEKPHYLLSHVQKFLVFRITLCLCYTYHYIHTYIKFCTITYNVRCLKRCHHPFKKRHTSIFLERFGSLNSPHDFVALNRLMYL